LDGKLPVVMLVALEFGCPFVSVEIKEKGMLEFRRLGFCLLFWSTPKKDQSDNDGYCRDDCDYYEEHPRALTIGCWRF
jgi:hypothetical protein